ncbi:uncharacterized protein CMC5_012440 [Chondromyces crocatus]|uniref:Uncharacterized protein n=1 Tax=Chondromyces crocatus TaxID=52 RepID=A0A0K1E8D9_CHOCO|nr:uncharacterized protein CMC5_012440 [Chondromyces crocatus]
MSDGTVEGPGETRMLQHVGQRGAVGRRKDGPGAQRRSGSRWAPGGSRQKSVWQECGCERAHGRSAWQECGCRRAHSRSAWQECGCRMAHCPCLRQPTGWTRQPTGPTRQPTGPTRQPTGPTRQPTGPTRQPTGWTRQPTGPTRQPTGPTRQPTGPTRQPTGPTRQPVKSDPHAARRWGRDGADERFAQRRLALCPASGGAPSCSPGSDVSQVRSGRNCSQLSRNARM